ncbi:hypothetical protein QYE76_064064 [Lolium multiflorum]|uniref:Uncharacterized protein n=1 Tax=Lolium multiflorum TaxID=4521 RepID=A0AAD8S640_LOLMU|nr:hypothetical protein QYE76_064064 [Lolium multiflorum]
MTRPDGDPFTGRRGRRPSVEEEEDRVRGGGGRGRGGGPRRDKEDEEEEDEEVPRAHLVEVDADGVRTKKKKNAGTRGPKWALEDLCLCESWATVSHDSMIGANQKYGKYWARIKAEFDERKVINIDYNKVTMKRSQKAMSTRWAIIHASVKSFHGYHNDIVTRADSCTDVAQLFDRAMDLYRKNSEGHKSFALMHCYSKLKLNEKWRLTLVAVQVEGRH